MDYQCILMDLLRKTEGLTDDERDLMEFLIKQIDDRSAASAFLSVPYEKIYTFLCKELERSCSKKEMMFLLDNVLEKMLNMRIIFNLGITKIYINPVLSVLCDNEKGKVMIRLNPDMMGHIKRPFDKT